MQKQKRSALLAKTRVALGGLLAALMLSAAFAASAGAAPAWIRQRPAATRAEAGGGCTSAGVDCQSVPVAPRRYPYSNNRCI